MGDANLLVTLSTCEKFENQGIAIFCRKRRRNKIRSKD